MTAQKSTNNFLANLLYRLKTNKKTIIVVMILHLLAAPLVLLNGIIYLVREQNYFEKYGGDMTHMPPQFNEMYVAIGAFATIIAVLCGIFIALNIFNYLYKKSNVDMILSLPMNTKQRFLSDFSAGAIAYLAPFLVSTIFTTILSFICQGVLKNSDSYSHYLKDLGATIPEYALKISLFGFFIMVMLYVITVLAVTFCGSFFEALSSVFYINALVPLSIFLGGQVFMKNLFGIDISESILPHIYRTNPIGGLIFTGIHFNNIIYANFSNVPTQNPYTYWLIPFIIVTALFFGLSYFLYSRRKAEQVSKPYVFKGFYHVVMTVITFIIVATFYVTADLEESIIPIIISSAIVWLIIEVITNRGFKKIWKAGIRYAITLSVIFAATLIVANTEGFGVIYKVPDVDDVKSVSILYRGVYRNVNIYSSMSSTTSNGVTRVSYSDDKGNPVDTNIDIKDKNSIKAIVDMQQAVLDEYKETKDKNNNEDIIYPYNYYDNVQIKYYLTNGKTMYRTYSVNSEQYAMLSHIDLTDEYIDEITGYISCRMLEDMNQRYYNDTRLYIMPLYNNESENSYQFNSKAEIGQFTNALAKDLKAMTPEEYFTPSKKSLCSIMVSSFNLTINENYSNVLAFIKEKGMQIPDVEITLATLNNYRSAYIIEYSENGYSNSEFYDYKTYDIEPQLNNVKFITEDDMPDLKILFENAQLYYSASPSDIKYVLNFNGRDYKIPPQYNDIAKKYLDYILFSKP